MSLSDTNPDPEKLVEQIKLNNGFSLVCKHERCYTNGKNIEEMIDINELIEPNNFLLEDALYQFEKIHNGDEL